MPNQHDAAKDIEEKISITPQDIALAKDFILNNLIENPVSLQKKYLHKRQINPIKEIVLHDTVDYQPQINGAATFISAGLAFGEAIWGLLHDGALIQLHENLVPINVNVGYTTVVPGSGGSTGGLEFNEDFQMVVPQRVRLAPSYNSQTDLPLFDPDVFISEVNIPELHPEVEKSLRVAVICLRQELLLPCLAMLGRASEGSWIELGIALLNFASSSSSTLDDSEIDQTHEVLTSNFSSIMKKIETVRNLYDRKDTFDSIYKESVKPKRLDEVINWSSILREYRNTIHYDNDPTSKISYDKVSTLLLSAGPNIRLIYSIRNATKELVAK